MKFVISILMVLILASFSPVIGSEISVYIDGVLQWSKTIQCISSTPTPSPAPTPTPTPTPTPPPTGQGSLSQPYVLSAGPSELTFFPGAKKYFTIDAKGHKALQCTVLTYNGYARVTLVKKTSTGLSEETLVRNSGGLFYYQGDFNTVQYIFGVENIGESVGNFKVGIQLL